MGNTRNCSLLGGVRMHNVHVAASHRHVHIHVHFVRVCMYMYVLPIEIMASVLWKELKPYGGAL